MKGNEIYFFTESNSIFRSSLQSILFEEYPWIKPDLECRNPERFVFKEDKCCCTQYFGTGREGSNWIVEGKSLYCDDPCFKKSFNEAIEATIAILKISKIK